MAPRHWMAFGESVKGASHERSGKPNQDRRHVKVLDDGRGVIAAVADGHGSPRSFRSDRGAQFATDVAIQVLSEVYAEYVHRVSDQSPAEQIAAFSELKTYAQTEVAQRIVNYWRERVSHDFVNHPFTEQEVASQTAEDRSSSNFSIAYGSTIVVVLVVPGCLLFMQLGDGDIIIVDEYGNEPTRPLPLDERSIANETVSLCGPGRETLLRRPGDESVGAWVDFRVSVVPMQTPPSLVLLTTDGYVNAFVSDSAFRKAASDILAFGRSEG